MKAKLTTNAGTFEFEGDDTAVEKQIAAVLSASAAIPSVQAIPALASTSELTKTKKRTSVPKRSVTQPKMLANLLASKEEVDSLRNLFDKKKPVSHIETFAVLTLWLRDSKNMPDASVDEMWSLYKVLGLRQPKNLIQTFRDGKSKKSYFDSNENGRYYITSYGETFVDHDLPAPVLTKGVK